MGFEIERKYLVDMAQLSSIISEIKSASIVQGYLNLDPERSVRVRLKNKKAFITIKGKTDGIKRVEFEYEIPFSEGEELLKLSTHAPIIKTRYEVLYKNFVWEVDVFDGENNGLIVAEIELPDEKTKFDLPNWAKEEVSDDIRYYNLALYQNPFCNWL
jgi:adenylate cyclase